MEADTYTDRQELAELLKEMLGEPLTEESHGDGSLVMISGDPEEVVVRVAGNTLTISEYGARWEGPHIPVVSPRRLATLLWRRVQRASLRMLLEVVIQAAREERRRQFRKCSYCQIEHGPEHMHSDDVCHGCAEGQLGVVH